MEYKKSIYLSDNKYYGKVEYISADQFDLDLFTKYSEPEFNIGGTFDDGITTFELPAYNKRVKTDSPFTTIFDPTSGGYDFIEAGKRAKLFVDTITSRIDTVITNLRNTDSTTNSENIKSIII